MKRLRQRLLGVCLIVSASGAAPSIAAPPPPPSPSAQAPTAVGAQPLPTAPVAIGGQPLTPAPGRIGSRPPIIPVAGPAPTGITVTGTPLVAQLSWNALPNVQRYAIFRLDGSSVSVEVTPAGFTATHWQDTVPDPRVTYRYAVVAYYPNGSSAAAPVVQFTSPAMINPLGFTARDQGQGQVLFQWQAVAGAVQYRLDGPGLPNTGYLLALPSTGSGGSAAASVANIPAGPGTWRLVALYPGNNADYPGASTASAVVHVLPPHSLHWLTKNNGAGALPQVQTPARQYAWNGAEQVFVGGGLTSYDPNYVTWLGQIWCTHGPDTATVSLSGNATVSLCARFMGLPLWLGKAYATLWDDAGHTDQEAIYGNAGDLGVGRRTSCDQTMRGPPVPGLYTVCYATAHGIRPGNTGFNDLQTITHPAAGVGSDFILSMVIVKDPTGTAFLVFTKGGAGLENPSYALSPTVQLDTEGPKLVPFACLSCHGGTYNAATRKVDGASLLPLDPELLVFASPADQAAQEEKLRTINLMIHNSDPNSPIAAYIRGLYNGAPAQPGARATPDYVPAGWAQQPGFYRAIVRPYCALCHLATPKQDNYNFASWGNFLGNGPLIRASVCAAHTMPHNELQYRAFWTKDTGPLYLPGLLAATLGFPSC